MLKSINIKRSNLAYCSHDGVPGSSKDFRVVVALIMCFQLFGEIISGELEDN